MTLFLLPQTTIPLSDSAMIFEKRTFFIWPSFLMSGVIGESGNLYRFAVSPPVARVQAGLNDDIRKQHIFNRGLIADVDEQAAV